MSGTLGAQLRASMDPERARREARPPPIVRPPRVGRPPWCYVVAAACAALTAVGAFGLMLRAFSGIGPASTWTAILLLGTSALCAGWLLLLGTGRGGIQALLTTAALPAAMLYIRSPRT